MEVVFNGRYMWHGVMITEGREKPFAIFADDMSGAVKYFDTLPDDAEVISLERGEEIDPKGIELSPAVAEKLKAARKKQLN